MKNDARSSGLASSSTARNINRDIVLELIRTTQPIARVELARMSGLQPSTISQIVEQLLAEGWIVEGSAVLRPRGRRPTMLSLNGDMLVLAVDLHPTQALVAAFDLHSRQLTQEQVPVHHDPARSTELILAAIKSVRAKHPGKRFEGIGVSVPGRVDPERQELILAPNLTWSGFDLRKVLQRRTGLQVEMENEANVSLIDEIWSGRIGDYQNIVLVSISEGIGAAILVNGQMVTGKSGMAGEFGHISLDPNGPVCGCGRRGCWEMFSSTRATLRHYRHISRSRAAITIADLVSMAEAGDKSAIAALQHQATYFGKGLQIVVTSLAPELIIATGDVTLSWPGFASTVQAELSSHLLAGKPPELSIIARSDLTRLRGAAALVLQRHAGYHRYTHIRRSTDVFCRKDSRQAISRNSITADRARCGE
jgi:predicted NBD/HSP70 family sugar kinase